MARKDINMERECAMNGPTKPYPHTVASKGPSSLMRRNAAVAVYASVLFAGAFLTPTFVNPRAHEEMAKHGESMWATPPRYPLGAWVVLFSPLAGGVCFGSVAIARWRGYRQDLAVAGLTFGGLMAFALVIGFNFGFDIVYLTTAAGFAGVLALIQGLRYHEFDLNFIKDAGVPRECRVERLKCIYDKWARSVIWFLGFAAVVLVSESLRISGDCSHTFGPLAARYLQVGMGVDILLVAPGIALGICWSVFQKLGQIGEAFTAMKE
jgi:hypothetical protein